MSQPGPKPSASPRPRRAASAGRHTQEHVNDKNTGSPSKPGENKGSDEKKAASLGSSQSSRTHAGATALMAKVPDPSGASSKSPSMSTAETKAVKTEPEKSQSSKPSVVHEKKSQEGKAEGHTEPKSHPKHASDKGSRHAHREKAASRLNEQLASEKSPEPKSQTKSQDMTPAAAGVAAAATSSKAEDKKNEEKSLTPAGPGGTKPDKSPGKSGTDAALDDLIDMLGEPEEAREEPTPYTGPAVEDVIDSAYLEALGIREGSIPPEYRKLLAKKAGYTGPPPDSPKPTGTDDAIEALSSDFTCSSSSSGGNKSEKEKSPGEVLKAQSAGVTRSAAPPQEKKRKVEKDAMSDQALQALSDSLGTRKPEPELDLSKIKEVNEAKAKEEKLEKCGEGDETVPAEYRLKPATDKDGKPLLPEHEEKSKPLSESEIIDELSEGFDQSKYKGKQPAPAEKAEKSKATASTPEAEPVPRASMCSVQSAPPQPAALKGVVPGDAVDVLAGSLGKREADPEDGKPVVDKVKEKAKEEDREKLGEKEETIPPDYRLEEVKDKDGKPLLPKESKEQLPPMSDDFLLDALSQDFSTPANISSLKFEDSKLADAISEVVSPKLAPTSHASAPPPNTTQHDKELDDALDKLSDRLGQRQPDPDESKPLEDKVKEKVKAEHRDKLGERDDTIPPEYRHLLDNDGKDKPEKPSSKKSKKPEDDQDPIDALSGDLDSCPTATETSQNTAKDKNKEAASSSKAHKNEGKAENPKTTEEKPKPKADEKRTS
uniref:calpastatin isoform X3 n=2 Tax=Jaculus jaculus TaxID=51337 RepID=UPI001E1B5DAC|nr:calpastatin isoform X3 [Jaculus jaculus]